MPDDTPSDLARLAAEAGRLARSLRQIVRARQQAMLPNTSGSVLRDMQHDAGQLIEAARKIETAVNALFADAEET